MRGLGQAGRSPGPKGVRPAPPHKIIALVLRKDNIVKAALIYVVDNNARSRGAFRAGRSHDFSVPETVLTSPFRTRECDADVDPHCSPTAERSKGAVRMSPHVTARAHVLKKKQGPTAFAPAPAPATARTAGSGGACRSRRRHCRSPASTSRPCTEPRQTTGAA